MPMREDAEERPAAPPCGAAARRGSSRSASQRLEHDEHERAGDEERDDRLERGCRSVSRSAAPIDGTGDRGGAERDGRRPWPGELGAVAVRARHAAGHEARPCSRRSPDRRVAEREQHREREQRPAADHDVDRPGAEAGGGDRDCLRRRSSRGVLHWPGGRHQGRRDRARARGGDRLGRACARLRAPPGAGLGAVRGQPHAGARGAAPPRRARARLVRGQPRLPRPHALALGDVGGVPPPRRAREPRHRRRGGADDRGGPRRSSSRPRSASRASTRALRAREPGDDRRSLTVEWMRANHGFHDVIYRIAEPALHRAGGEERAPHRSPGPPCGRRATSRSTSCICRTSASTRRSAPRSPRAAPTGARELAREHVLASFRLLETILEQVGRALTDEPRRRAADAPREAGGRGAASTRASARRVLRARGAARARRAPARVRRAPRLRGRLAALRDDLPGRRDRRACPASSTSARSTPHKAAIPELVGLPGRRGGEADPATLERVRTLALVRGWRGVEQTPETAFVLAAALCGLPRGPGRAPRPRRPRRRLLAARARLAERRPRRAATTRSSPTAPGRASGSSRSGARSSRPPATRPAPRGPGGVTSPRRGRSTTRGCSSCGTSRSRRARPPRPTLAEHLGVDAAPLRAAASSALTTARSAATASDLTAGAARRRRARGGAAACRARLRAERCLHRLL